MKMSKKWIDHIPDNLETNNAESDCECSIDERHTHCLCCGKVVSIGDWDAPPVAVWEISAH